MDRHSFDALYLERLRSGDPQTERHFCSYFNDLIRLKVRARGLAAAFDDIRQETFVRVLRTVRAPDGLRDPGALGAFVNSVCGNVILETGRSRKASGADPSGDADETPDPGPDAEAQVLIDERRFAVRSVIDTLEPRDRELLAAVFLEEQDRDRVCQRMGVTREYLRVLLHRAKHAFMTRYLTRADRPAAPGASAALFERRNR